MSVVFYDTETTGTLHEFDQILQFAAIRADAELKEVERFESRCHLLPHVVPSPEALSVTRISLSRLIDASLPSHYQMVRAVREKLLSWPNAMFLGWNSIRFDEELMRQALYQTLHPPYLTNTNGNCRTDVMRMVQACSRYAPEAITFARDASGQLVFRLQAVAEANDFASPSAHDAMHEAEAGIFLARLIMESAPRVWSSFMRFSKKAAVLAFTEEESVFCLHNYYAGELLSCFGTRIGQNPDNKAELFIYDLEHDPQELASLSDDDLKARFDIYPKPIRVLKANAAPILFSVEDASDVAIEAACAPGELDQRAKFVRDEADFGRRLLAVYESLKPEYPISPHVEGQIYNGFFNDSDNQLMELFHSVEWEKREAIIEDFQDERLRTLGRRLIYIERPDLLDKCVCENHDRELATRLLGLAGNEIWMTLPKAIQELATILGSASEDERTFFLEHDNHLRRLISRFQDEQAANGLAT